MTSFQNIESRIQQWDTEEDYIGLKVGMFHFVINRNMWSGHLNGYIGIPEHHSYYRKDMHEEGISQLVCHGGITYAGKGEFLEDASEDYWYLGFDCMHYGDHLPNVKLLASYLPHNWVTEESIYSHLSLMEQEIAKEVELHAYTLKRREEELNIHEEWSHPKQYKDVSFVWEQLQRLHQQLNHPKLFKKEK